MPENDSTDLKIETPGDGPSDPVDAPTPKAAKGSKAAKGDDALPALNTDDDSPEVAALKAENAQLRATVEQLNQNLMDIADSQAAPQKPAEPREPRLIGQDWSSMTAAEAQASGCTERVLCRDGYYIPG